jgi:hypothetical protein
MRPRTVRSRRVLALGFGALSLVTAGAADAQVSTPDSGTVVAYDAFDGLTATEIETFLLKARVVEVVPIGSGVTKPLRATLDDGGVRHDAEVQVVDSCEATGDVDLPSPEITCDSYRYNVAAYLIGKLLGLTSIPPTVLRVFGGRPAAFTWWVERAHTLADMEVHGQWSPDMEEWQRQAGTVTLFDELICNTDRHQANLLMDPLRRVWLIDHTRAFRVRPRLRNPDRLEGLEFDRSLMTRLRGLNEAALETCCGAFLSREERADVLARRDSILALLRESDDAPAPGVR